MYYVWSVHTCFCGQVSTQGLPSTPLNLAVSWKCEPTSTDLRIDYKYNGEAMSTPMALNNVQFLVPVDGNVSKLQAVLPPAAWYTTHLLYLLNSAVLIITSSLRSYTVSLNVKFLYHHYGHLHTCSWE